MKALLPLIAVFLASTIAIRGDTTVVLGQVERDLTGDGALETLTVIAIGPTIDSLHSVTFTIASSGRIIYSYSLAPLTRTVGFDAGRHRISSAEHAVRLSEFENWFFADSKFRQPATFLEFLRVSAREHVGEIPAVMVRHREPADSGDAAAIWQEMQKSPITIFTFSPGGDAIVAIGWSQRTKRFYRLLECC